MLPLKSHLQKLCKQKQSIFTLRGPHGGAKHELGELVMEEVRTPWFNAGGRDSIVTVLCWHSYLIVSFVLVVVFYVVVEAWISTGWDRRDQGGLRFVRRGRHAAHSSTGLATVHPILEPAKKSGKMKGCKNRHQRGPTSWAIFEPSWVGSSILSFWCILIQCIFEVFHLRYILVFLLQIQSFTKCKENGWRWRTPCWYLLYIVTIVIIVHFSMIQPLQQRWCGTSSTTWNASERNQLTSKLFWT